MVGSIRGLFGIYGRVRSGDHGLQKHDLEEEKDWMKTIRLLALDLAGRTGYAMKFRSGKIKVGVVNLTRGQLTGKRNPLPMVRLWNRLNWLSDHYRIRRVVFEETFAQGSAKYRLDSLQHATILWAVNQGIQWRRVSPTEWKKAMLGEGQVSRHDYSRVAIERFPEIRFWTDDQCAAMWLLMYGLRR